MSSTSWADYWVNLFSMGLRQPQTLETLRKDATPDFSKAESHTLKAEEIDAIRRLQSRGFRVIDLDPNLLPKGEFNCVYPSDIIANLTGENLTSTMIDGSGANWCPNPYWRTFAFDCPGNWLKIEVLPVRQEVGRDLFVTPLEQPVSLTPSGTIATANPAVISEASRRTMLLDFEAPTASPHIITDGMVFKTYFSAFFLTVKNLNTKIRITIGYNSSIEDCEQKETSLALFGGRGITTKPQLAPTPFAMSNRDWITLNNPFYGVEYTSGTLNLPLILCADVPTIPGTPLGGGVVWINSFSACMFYPASVASSGGLYQLELMLWEIDNNYTPVSPLKRFGTLNMNMRTSWKSTDTEKLILSEPIRVSLPPMTALCIVLQVISDPTGGSGVTYLRYDLGGYVLGGFHARELSGLSYAPFYITDYVKENPWPMDYAFDGTPQRI